MQEANEDEAKRESRKLQREVRTLTTQLEEAQSAHEATKVSLERLRYGIFVTNLPGSNLISGQSAEPSGDLIRCRAKARVQSKMRQASEKRDQA